MKILSKIPPDSNQGKIGKRVDLFSLSWWIIAVGVFLSAFIRGALGFAFALLLSPILLLFLSPKEVVVTDINLSLISNIFNILTMRKLFVSNIKSRILLPLMVGCLFGMPIGAYVLTVIYPAFFKIFVGSVIIVFSTTILFGFTFSLKNFNLVPCVSGMISGFLTTSTSLGGPPVVLYLHGQNLSKEAIYCNQVIYWLFMLIVSLFTLLLSQIISVNMIFDSFSLIPPLLIGMTFGMRAFWFLNTRFFRSLTIYILILSGFMAILSGMNDFI